MSLQDNLKVIFDQNGYTWRINGELQSPTADDIQKTIDKAVQVLSKEDATASTPQLEIGGLIIQLNDGHYDVYVHIGEATLTKETA